jgi:hypothetical protein
VGAFTGQFCQTAAQTGLRIQIAQPNGVLGNEDQPFADLGVSVRLCMRCPWPFERDVRCFVLHPECA